MSTGQAPKRKQKVFAAAMTSDPGVRFHDFMHSWLKLGRHMKDRLYMTSLPGVNVTHNCNEAVRTMLEDSDADFLWLIADDHVFEPDIIDRLMAHDKNVIVPHCLKRVPGYEPVVYHSSDEEGIHWVANLPQKGPIEVHAAGSAGMLIRRSVLEALEKPWFRTYGKQNEDLVFCERLRDEAGETIWCDPEVLLGHIGLVCVFPSALMQQGKFGGWGVQLALGTGDQNQDVYFAHVGDSLRIVS